MCLTSIVNADVLRKPVQLVFGGMRRQFGKQKSCSIYKYSISHFRYVYIMDVYIMNPPSPIRLAVMATTGILQQLIGTPDRLHSLVEEVKELAFQHGILLRTQETPNSSEVETTAQTTCQLLMYFIIII